MNSLLTDWRTAIGFKIAVRHNPIKEAISYLNFSLRASCIGGYCRIFS